MFPAYLQLAPLPEEPCSSGNAADYQWQVGITGVSPLRGTLRAAPKIKRREYHYTLSLHRRNQPHHTVFRLSVDRSLRSRRSWRQKPSCFAETERSAALDIQLSRNREGGSCLPLHFTTDIFLPVDGPHPKIFFAFF